MLASAAGLAQPLDWTRSSRQGWVLRPSLSRRPEASSVVVVAAPSFPDHDLIRSEIRRGVETMPQATTWVVPFGPQQRNGVPTGLGVIRETLESLGVEPLVAVKCEPYELAACAGLVVAFHDGANPKTQWYTDRAAQPWGKNIRAVVRPAGKRAA